MDREHYERAHLPKYERIGQAVPKEPMAGQPGPATHAKHRETRRDVGGERTPEHELGLRVLEILRHYREDARHMGAPLSCGMRAAYTEDEIIAAARSLGLLPADAKDAESEGSASRPEGTASTSRSRKEGRRG